MKTVLAKIFDTDVIRVGLVLLVSIWVVDVKVAKLRKELHEFARFKGCYL